MPRWVWGSHGRRYALPDRAVADTARLLTDLREVRALVGYAVQDRHCAIDQLARELRLGGRANGALLRRVIAEVTAGVRSAPEAELRDLIVKAGLPAPLFNPRLYLPNGRFLACPDAWWPEAGVAIEMDSREWHLAPADWERTMNRHSDLGQHGIVTLHVTPHQLRTNPEAVARKAANAYKTGTTRPRLDILTLPAAALRLPCRVWMWRWAGACRPNAASLRRSGLRTRREGPPAVDWRGARWLARRSGIARRWL